MASVSVTLGSMAFWQATAGKGCRSWISVRLRKVLAQADRALRMCLKAVLIGAAAVSFIGPNALSAAPAVDAGFAQWLAQLWPEAQSRGITRATFDMVTQGLQPDLSLPDLDLPGRRQTGSQAEFVQTPAQYLKEASIERLAAQGRTQLARHRASLSAIEKRFGVPAPIVLAIWARETNFGTATMPYSAMRALATQAYLGRRKEQFRQELLEALLMLQEGSATLAEMRSSWAGAMGQPQVLPSGFRKYAVDMDGDGRRDIWNSVPDALGTIANHLVDIGWQPDQRWAYEVHAPENVDCRIAQPENKLPLREWLKKGFVPAYQRKLGAEELAQEASLLMPAGLYGPAFLVTNNYFALKNYNFSDLYVLFVGHLADRIVDPRPFEQPWQTVEQLPTQAMERMQKVLTSRGFYKDKIDGKAGMLTRSALGAYQGANNLRIDCWPTQAVVDHMLKGGPTSPMPKGPARK